jgi:plastocyanin
MIFERNGSWSLRSGKHLLRLTAMIGLFTVCGPSVADPADATKVVVKDYKFAPTPLTVKVGATVTWTNTDDEPHNATSDNGVFKSGGMDTNDSFSFKFDKPGTYHYTCTIHPRMIGTIIVE